MRARDLWPDKGAFKSEAESAGERIAARRRAERRREQAEAETQRRAWEVWNKAAIPVSETESDPDFHPYNIERGPGWTGNSGYIRRGPWPFNGGKDKDALLLALVDIEGDLWSIEALGSRADVFEIGKGRDGFKTGRKSFMPGAMRDGIFFPFTDFGAQTRAFYIGEGFFTVQAAMYGVPVDDLADGTRAFLSACTAGKLEAVARAVRTKYPDAEIILLKDEDPAGEAANRAAQAVGGKVARPSAALPDGTHPKEHFDFWDLHHEHGPDAVQAALDAAQAPTLKDTMEDARRAEEAQRQAQDEDREARLEAEARAMLEKAPAIDIWKALTVEPPPRQYILEGYLPTGIVSILAAPGGTGKSYLAKIIATAVAAGRNIPPFEVKAPAPVLIISAEDDARDIEPRLYRIGKEYNLTHWEMQRLRDNLIVRPMRGVIRPLMEPGPYGTAPQATAGTKALAILMEEHKPALVILDTKSRLFGLTENTAEDNSAWVNNLEALLADHPDTSFLVLSHTGKKNIETLKTQNAERGSSASTDNARAGFVYLKHTRKNKGGEEEHLTTPDGAKLFVLSHVKSNYAAPRPDVYFIQGYGGVPVMVEDPDTATEATRRAVLAQALGILCEQMEKQPGGAVHLFPLLNGRAKDGCTDEIRGIREYLKVEGGIDYKDIGDVVNYGLEVEKLVKEPDPESKSRTPPILIRLANPPKGTPQGADEGTQNGLF